MNALSFLPPACAVALSMLLLAGAEAADPPGQAACRSDARSLCSGLPPGGGRIVACLKEHEGRLSDTCKAELPALQRCAAELQQLCPGGGARERRSCLRDNAARLSPECRGIAPAR